MPVRYNHAQLTGYGPDGQVLDDNGGECICDGVNCCHAAHHRTSTNEEKLKNVIKSAKGTFEKPYTRKCLQFRPPPLPKCPTPNPIQSPLYNGSKFNGFQKSKGSSYEVDVIIHVRTIKLVHCFV